MLPQSDQHDVIQPVEGVAPLVHTASNLEAVVTVAVVLGLSALCMWLLTLDWVLEIVAPLITLATVCAGIAVGVLTYKKVLRPEGLPRWARLTIAIVLGVTFAAMITELTHSHRLIRMYNVPDEN